jgi:hypothetical protein
VKALDNTTWPIDPAAWEEGTRRGWVHHRSCALKELDKKFASYHNAPADRTRTRFIAAFDAWYQKHPRERNSRNLKSQAVTRLKSLRDHTDAPAPVPPSPRLARNGVQMAPVTPELLRRLPPPAPRHTPTRNLDPNHGTETLGGREFTLRIQGLDSSCGPACVSYVAGTLKGRRVPESVACRWVSDETEASNRGFGDAAQQRMDQMVNVGTRLSALMRAIVEGVGDLTLTTPVGIVRCPSPDELRNQIRLHVNADCPGILQLTWWDTQQNQLSRFSHFVVVGDRDDNSCWILDSWYGLQQLPWSELPLYRPVPSINAKTNDNPAGVFHTFLLVTG